MQKLSCSSYGKINLMLNISGRRDDGYHTLETVMQTVSLRDTVDIRLSRGQTIELRCSLPYIPCDSRNVAYKAAELFFDTVGERRRAEISIAKTVPVGGGMGGGSANAATVLDMLNRMLGYPVEEAKLYELALALGADVPFCLARGTFLAEGIGEKLTPLDDMPKCHIVVCKPRFSVSSKNAYGIYDEYEPKEHFSAEAMVKALASGNMADIASAMGNSFEAPIAALHPEIAELKSRLLREGAEGAAMTGSGSVVFGLFSDGNSAHRAKNTLRRSGYRTYCVSPIGRRRG